MVYISFPTENGTLYTRTQLMDLHTVCQKRGLPLFVDGARLGYGLAAAGNDISLADFARFSDVFYIGGTKVGALMGEAVVIVNEKLKPDFRYNIKQRGGMPGIFAAISSGVGSRPSSWVRSRLMRFSFTIVSVICTGRRISRLWSAIARTIDWRIHQIA